jgi:hypothetical protein
MNVPWTLAAALDSGPEEHDGRQHHGPDRARAVPCPGRRGGRLQDQGRRRRQSDTRPPGPAVARDAGARALCRAAGRRMRVRGAAQAGADSRSGQSRRVRAGAAVEARGGASDNLVLPCLARRTHPTVGSRVPRVAQTAGPQATSTRRE